MDVATARTALGVGPGAAWAEVRTAYRAAMQSAHPDREGGSTQRAAALNEAYATLVRARRAPPPAPPPEPAFEPAFEPPPGAVVAAGDTLHLPVPADEAFAVVLEACHRLADVTYVDRQCGILEAVLQLDGEGTCSLVVTFQGRAHGTEAFCTLEAIEHVGSPPVGPIVRRLGECAADVLQAFRP